MTNLKDKAPLLSQIAEFIHGFKKAKVDIKTLSHTAIVTADTYGTAFSGIKTDAFKTAFKSMELFFGKGNFEVWGTNSGSSILGATFYNALAISSTDFDEGHRKAVGHPASAIVPIAIVLGKSLNKSHEEILKSVVIGYEIGTRFSMSRLKEKITTYSTGRWAAMASATTAAYLLDLNTDEISHALSNAAVLSPVMLGGSTDVATGSMSKEGVAWAVQSGLQSALMAKEGFSGPYLFVDAHKDYNTNILISNLGKSFLINSNYFKPYSCCRWLHSAIKSAEEIRDDEDFSIGEIKQIKIFTFARALDLVDEKCPDNTVKAQFHLPFVVALMLTVGRVSPEYFQKNNLKNRSVLSLIDKISLVAEDAYTKAFPEKLPSRVEIKFTNGNILKKEVLVAPWEYGFHPSNSELKKKFKIQTSGLNHIKWDLFFE